MAMSEDGGGKNQAKARVVLQQCLSARLEVKPADEASEAEFVEIGRGMVVFLCFLKGASSEIVDKMVKSIMNVRLSETDDGKRVSILELPGDVLIVPQATLGGRVKGRVVQYHGNVDKSVGESLYNAFVEACEREVSENCGNTDKQISETVVSPVVKHGTYGNRQVLSLNTNGPYTHQLEFQLRCCCCL